MDDNINKISRINTNLSDSSYRQSHYEKGVEKNKVEKVKFSDIYDIKMLSAQMNKSSSEFRLESVEEVNRELKNVIADLSENRTDDIVTGLPSEDILELAKLMWKNNH